MDYVFLIAGAIVILTCFYFIVSPFFTTAEKHSERAVVEEETLTLDQIYSAVNELEMDYLMKKITAEDFGRLKEQYQLLAAELMKTGMDGKKPAGSRENGDEAEAEILRELRKLRKQKG
ncbi:hypothetical protein [Bacillus sp. REN3]|uniref:hypothetical protein n=1 Tax=Bacillus sp. REN3 TaxID=2802440 RepID=UPI001AED1B3F|nr:hypothetical protein [Bacillus sp. REN3]